MVDNEQKVLSGMTCELMTEGKCSVGLEQASSFCLTLVKFCLGSGESGTELPGQASSAARTAQ